MNLSNDFYSVRRGTSFVIVKGLSFIRFVLYMLLVIREFWYYC